jgi:transposase
LYDLTNTYFEGRKVNSKIAKFGRSKEKRSDCKLVVLAMVVNVEGFIKYSNIFEGNTSDSDSLPKIIDTLRQETSQEKRAIVVLDAGIATQDNLALLQAKGYDYVCVSRSKIKDYSIDLQGNTRHIMTKENQFITLQKLNHYGLKVHRFGFAD